jgi:hypothetical protein
MFPSAKTQRPSRFDPKSEERPLGSIATLSRVTDQHTKDAPEFCKKLGTWSPLPELYLFGQLGWICSEEPQP